MSDLLEQPPGPALSVVVIGRNEGDRLARCLESIGLIRGIDGGVELLYVDSASTDRSPEAARNSGAEVIVLQGGSQTAARGRNAGWQRASAPYVLFLDGDTILNQDFPQAAFTVLQSNPNIAAVWGHRRELYPDRSIYNWVLDLDWIYAPGFTEFCGGDVVMRRSALVEAGGYDSELIAGEEPELCRRLRERSYLISHIDFPMTGHDLNMTRFSQYWRRAVRAGYAYAELATRYRASADPMWQLESQRNLLSGIFWIAWLSLSLALLAFKSLWIVPWLAVPVALSARSAWKARGRAPGKTILLLLYGFHSHLAQVPILVGQLKYYRDRHSGKQAEPIEYKEGAGALTGSEATRKPKLSL
jgi:glycosyltransferase involved in cell wall biosynthesis